MGIPVKVHTRMWGIVTAMAGELQNLIHEGQVSLEEAAHALKDAGVALDPRQYPWLHLIPRNEPEPVTPETDVSPAAEATEAADNTEGA